MGNTNSRNDDFAVEVVGHADEEKRLLMFRVTAAEGRPREDHAPMNVSVVLDRSGSMAGAKLTIAKDATARLVRSLSSRDRIGVVVYDHVADTLVDPTEPTDGMAELIGRIQPRGSTDLHAGWRRGVSQLASGGRVILLSDGLANVGRYTDADSLSHLAGSARRTSGVTTTTIGVGGDYDELLMSRMAEEGGGNHYFCPDAESIMKAFSNERFALGAMTVEGARILITGASREVGSFWEGETKVVVLEVDSFPSGAELKYRLCSSEQESSLVVELPAEYVADFDVTAAYLVEGVIELDREVAEFRSGAQAQRLMLRARKLLLECLNHPNAEGGLLLPAIARLQQLIPVLDRQSIRYDEPTASHERKRSQRSHRNFSEPAKAFYTDAGDARLAGMVREAVYGPPDVALSASYIEGVSKDDWVRWQAVPIEANQDNVVVVMHDPTDGFVVAEIEKAVGRRVVIAMRAVSEVQVRMALGT